MVESCALEADLVQLEGGDNTEIGEEEEEGQIRNRIKIIVRHNI